MSSIADQIKYQFRTGGMYIKLIYINIALYIFFGLFFGITQLMKWELTNYDMISDLLCFNSSPKIFIRQPWSLITYMFMHGSIMHILSNMIILFFAGKMFESYLGAKKMLSTYIIGGIFGAAFFMISQNIFPLLLERGNDIPMLGASAAVFAILVGLATYIPNHEVFLFGIIRVKLKYLAIVWVAIDLAGLTNNDGTAHFAHLGGAVWGLYMISLLKRGKDISSWFDKFISQLIHIFKPRKKIKIVFKKKKKTTYSSNQRNTPPRDDYKYNEDKKKRQEEIDKILDKIKDSGYESLTKAEKDYLFDASKNI